MLRNIRNWYFQQRSTIDGCQAFLSEIRELFATDALNSYLRSQLVHPEPVGVRRVPVDEDEVGLVDPQEVVWVEGVGHVHLPLGGGVGGRIDVTGYEIL